MFTYENQGINSYLVYTLEPGDVIDEVTLGMLANNEIAGLSPIIFNQMNEQKICRFNITARQTLADFFSRPVGKQQFLTILRNMLNTIMNLDSYLIPSSALLYETKSIYIDIHNMEIRMICLPVEAQSQKVDLQNFFRNLIFTTNYMQTENCDYVAKLINFFNSTPGFDIQACLELIRGLMRDGVIPRAVQPQQTIPQSAAPQPEVPQPEVPQLEMPRNTAAQPKQLPPNPREHVQAQPEEGTRVKEAGLAKPKNGNARCIQQPNRVPRQGTPQPQIPKPPVHSSIPIPPRGNPTQVRQEQTMEQSQVIPPVSQQVEKKKGFHLFGKKKDAPEEQPVNPGFAIPGQKPGVQPRQQAMQQPIRQPIQQPVRPSMSQQGMSQHSAQAHTPQPAPQPQQPRYDFGNTTVLNQGMEGNGETTVLSNNLYTPKPYLIRIKNGEQITIDKSSFRIGRERSYVDYFIGDNSAIGRSHAEIITENSIYYIVDMNSRNHTYVNGIMITSGTRVQIENGTKLRLADEEFEFRYV